MRHACLSDTVSVIVDVAALVPVGRNMVALTATEINFVN